MKRSILSICILLASVSLVFANIYKKYDVRSGLSGNCVRSILQDSIGYMWFATQDGLNRFNGIEFTNYGHSSENGGNSCFRREMTAPVIPRALICTKLRSNTFALVTR